MSNSNNSWSPSMFPNEIFPIEAENGGPGDTAKGKLLGLGAGNLLTSALALLTAAGIITGSIGGSEPPPDVPPPPPTEIVQITAAPTPTPLPSQTPAPTPSATPSPTPAPTPVVTPKPTPKPTATPSTTPTVTPTTTPTVTPVPPTPVVYTKPAPQPMTTTEFSPPTIPPEDGPGYYTVQFPFTLNDGIPVSVVLSGSGTANDLYPATVTSADLGEVTYDLTNPNLTVTDTTATATWTLPNSYMDFALNATLNYTMPDDSTVQQLSTTGTVSPTYFSNTDVAPTRTITDTHIHYSLTAPLRKGTLPFRAEEYIDCTDQDWNTVTCENVNVTVGDSSATLSFSIPIGTATEFTVYGSMTGINTAGGTDGHYSYVMFEDSVSTATYSVTGGTVNDTGSDWPMELTFRDSGGNFTAGEIGGFHDGDTVTGRLTYNMGYPFEERTEVIASFAVDGMSVSTTPSVPLILEAGASSFSFTFTFDIWGKNITPADVTVTNISVMPYYSIQSAAVNNQSDGTVSAPSFSHQNANAATDVTVSVSVTNPGEVQSTYSISILYGGYEIVDAENVVTLEPARSHTFRYNFRPDSDVTNDTMQIIITNIAAPSA